MRLIDADALKKESVGYKVMVSTRLPSIPVVSFEEIDEAPTIDPSSLRSTSDRLQSIFAQSDCEYVCLCRSCYGVVGNSNEPPSAPCPNCGADMRGESHDPDS